MMNQLKLRHFVEKWEVLEFQALKIPYLSNLNQVVVLLGRMIGGLGDFLQQSIMVILVFV